jgi:hypothetical protein
MGTGGSFPGVNRQGREADHTPTTSVEVKKNVDLYIHSLTHLHGIILKLVKHRDNFTFTLLTYSTVLSELLVKGYLCIYIYCYVLPGKRVY